jgi:hypothetical protein
MERYVVFVLSLMGPDEKRNGGIVSAIAEKLN